MKQPHKLGSEHRIPKPPPAVAPPEPDEVRHTYATGVVLGWTMACDAVALYGIAAARGHQASLERWLADPRREGIPFPGDELIGGKGPKRAKP